VSLAGLCVAVATLALSIAVVVSITGGFLIDLGPLHLSAHRTTAPLVIAAIAYAAGAATGRHRVRDAAPHLFTRIDTHGLAIAITFAAATAGVGMAFGTYAASGADAGGYIGQADLLAHGQIAFDEPLVRRVAWPDAAWTFAPLGFRPGRAPGEIVPTYPPGLPLVMVLASMAAGDVGPFLVSPLLGAACVVAAYLLGARVHSRTAGVVAAALLATSPIWLFQIVQAMSDVPATALWTLALLAATSGAALAAGLITSLAILVRPNLFLLAASVAIVLVVWSRDTRAPFDLRASVRTILIFAAASAVGVAALAATQWRLYGSPIASGHGTFAELFAMGNIPENVRDYVVRVCKGETPALLLAVAAVATLLLTRRSSPRTSSFSASLWLLLLTTVPLLVSYLPYGVFPDWSYLRFFLPAFPAAFIVVGALVVDACQRIPATARGTVLSLTLVAACSANVMIARREATFDLRRYEERYQTAGRYLDAALPREAVIVTSQESASAHHYTQRPILRWDLLTGDLDAAVATLIAAGRPPVLLIEDWEEPLLRARFPSSSIAPLDWRSRALFGATTRVRYLDPADREDPARAGSRDLTPHTDRLP